MTRIHWGIPFVLVLFAGTALSANAEQIYRWRMSDGTALYTDVPYNEGKLEKTLTVPPPDSKEAEQAERAKLRREAAQATRIAEHRELSLDTADTEIRAASLALESAKIKLHAGLEPRGGERLATVGGNTRLSDAYWRRVRALEQAVQGAQERLSNAYIARNDLR
jgi:hypothetical protein